MAESFKSRTFQSSWTEQYFVREVKNRPVCLICDKSQTLNKLCNISRHYSTAHGDHDSRFPHGTEIRKERLHKLLQQAQAGENMLRGNPSNIQTAATLASYQVCFKLSQSMVPFTHSELVKSCMLSTIETLFPEKPELKSAIAKVPLRRNTFTRRVEEMGDSIFNSVLEDVMACESFSLALDETIDIRDTAQLAVFVRYYLNQKYQERLLTMLSLKGRATGLVVFNSFETFMTNNKVLWEKIVSVSTDGAPAMVGKHCGFVKYLRDRCPNLIACHCIIHDSMLCAKLKNSYANLMLKYMKMINYLKSKSGLRHRQLIAFLQDMEAEYDDLLTYNNVRWLSKGRSLERIWSLRTELITFLQQQTGADALEFAEMLLNPKMMSDMAFLVDMLSKLNDLNLKLQGRNKDIASMWVTIKGFQNKLAIFHQDVSGDSDHFPTLKEYLSTLEEPDMVPTEDAQLFIADLITEFNDRFKACKDIDQLIDLMSSPNTTRHLWKNQLPRLGLNLKTSDVMLELCDFTADTASVNEIAAKGIMFWSLPVIQEKYNLLSQIGMRLSVMFGSTYLCEALFSKLAYIKNKYRSQLTDVHTKQLLVVAIAETTPDFSKIMSEKQCQGSH